MRNKVLVAVIEGDSSATSIAGLGGLVIPANSDYRIQRVSGLSFLESMDVISQMALAEGVTHLFILNALTQSAEPGG